MHFAVRVVLMGALGCVALTSKANAQDRRSSRATIRCQCWSCYSSTTIRASTDVLQILATRKRALGALSAAAAARLPQHQLWAVPPHELMTGRVASTSGCRSPK